MSKAIDWVKGNVPIVACSAAILVVLPAAWFGSSWWNNKIRTAREQAAQKVDTELSQVRVSYNISSVFPNGPQVTLPMEAPNPEVTKVLKEARSTLDAQVTQVVAVANEINKGGHKPLIDGLFPTPSDRLLTLTFMELLVGKGDKASAYENLLKSINAGGPADAVKLAEILIDERTQAIERNKAEKNDDKLSPDDEAKLSKQLQQMRVGEYQRHARTISVYASPDFFPQAPRAIPPEPPTEVECFRWQMDYWAVEDLLRAVDAANRKGDGTRTMVADSVVKRIELVMLEPMAGGGESPAQGQPSMASGGGGGVSLTGRKTDGGPTAPFDLRHAEMRLVVASARLPELLSAVSRTNFMTATSLGFSEMNPWDDLDQGYYYGQEHVVRVTLRIESVWLRSWTTPLMPEAYKAAMKPAEAAAPEPAPAAAPAAQPRGEEDGGRRNTPGRNNPRNKRGG